MSEHRLLGLLAGIVLRFAWACAILLPAPSPAQENPTAALPATPEADACADLTVFPKLLTSIIRSCQRGDSVGVTVPLKPDAQGNAREKSVWGSYEFREYQLVQADQQEHAFDNLMQLLPMTGFIVKYSDSPSTITARKENVWMLIRVSGEYYNVSLVTAKEESWNPIKDAEGISRDMEAHNRAAIYGIQFSPGGETINEKDSKILLEVLKYLKANPSLAVIVESHKFSTQGKAEDDLEITRRRANAVVDWLVAHGVTAGRLQSKPFGQAKPVTENDTPLEIQQNERIELALVPGTVP